MLFVIFFYFLLCFFYGIKVKNNFYENNFWVFIRNDGSVNKFFIVLLFLVRVIVDDKMFLD